MPVMSAVNVTPSVARTSDGFQVKRMDDRDVPKPPSKRIRARATVPMACARR